MAERLAASAIIQLIKRKYKQLRRHKHPLALENEVNGQKIDPFWLIKNLKGWRDDEEIFREQLGEEEEEHKHTLILNEDNKYDGDKFPSCELCDELILGPCYSCSKNNSSLVDDECCSSCGYYLHKSCVQEATPTMHHPIHPHRPLTVDQGLGQTCDSCRVVCNGLIYSCQDCNFKLHMKCAFSLFLDHKILNTTTTTTTTTTSGSGSGIHQHPLILFSREALLLCDGCGTEHKGFFYFCNTCMESDDASSFAIHRNCALLPSTIKHRDHPPHLLNLSYSLPTQYSQFRINCKICSKWINPKYWIYYCGGCRYFVHVHCATATLLLTTAKTSKEDGIYIGESSKQQEEETSKTDPCNSSSLFPINGLGCETDTNTTTYTDPNVIRLPLPDESVSVTRHLIKQMTLEEDKKVMDSHNHPLILHDVQSKFNSSSSSKSSLSNVEKNDGICNFCTKPIMNAAAAGSFYNCAQCSFSFHEFCAALPTEVRSPRHQQHSLILRAKATTSLDWSCCRYCQRGCYMFRLNLKGCECKHCSPISDDFAFYCASCKFFVHINCALSPGAITHESHPQHILIMKEVIGINGNCNACGDTAISGTAFECKTCSFNLHIWCAYLPRTFKHRYDKLHPFTLTYSPLEDHPDEYLCEICETEINPDGYWFYHCAVCDQSLHRHCILEWSFLGYCSKAT